MRLLRDESSSWGRRPQNPWDLPHSRQNDGARRQIARPPLIPAAESALGLRPRSALSSAQVFPEWITSTSPCNDLSTNGDNPLNFVSHSRGSVQAATMPPVAPTIFEAVKDQMGLKLELRGTTQVSVLVVDRAEKLPEPN